MTALNYNLQLTYRHDYNNPSTTLPVMDQTIADHKQMNEQT